MIDWFSGSCVWIAVCSASLVHPAEATERDEGEMGMRRRETGGEMMMMMMWLTCDRMELLCWYKERNTQTINLHTHPHTPSLSRHTPWRLTGTSATCLDTIPGKIYFFQTVWIDFFPWTRNKQGQTYQQTCASRAQSFDAVGCELDRLYRLN